MRKTPDFCPPHVHQGHMNPHTQTHSPHTYTQAHMHTLYRERERWRKAQSNRVYVPRSQLTGRSAGQLTVKVSPISHSSATCPPALLPLPQPQPAILALLSSSFSIQRHPPLSACLCCSKSTIFCSILCPTSSPTDMIE